MTAELEEVIDRLGIASTVLIGGRDESGIAAGRQALERGGVTAVVSIGQQRGRDKFDGALLLDPSSADLDTAAASVRPGGTIFVGGEAPELGLQAHALALSETEVCCLRP